MNLYAVRPVNNDWLEAVARPDAVQFQLDSIQEQFAALQISIQQLRQTLAMPQPLKKYGYLIQYPNGAIDRWTGEHRSMREAEQAAEQIALDLHEFAIVKSIQEIEE